MILQQKLLIDQLRELERKNQLLKDSNKFQEITLYKQIRQKNKCQAIYRKLFDKRKNSQYFLNQSLLNRFENQNMLRTIRNSKYSFYDNNIKLKTNRENPQFDEFKQVMNPQDMPIKTKVSQVDTLKQLKHFKQILRDEKYISQQMHEINN